VHKLGIFSFFIFWLLQPQQNLSIRPQLFQIIKLALVGGKKMYDDVTVIHDHPAIAGKALLLSPFIMFGPNVVNRCVGKRVDHAVAGAGTDNEIVGKRDNAFQVNQDNIFTLFVFKGVYNFSCKFKCVQVSPHGLDNDAENNFV
jgi:hypothetical protein